jgi:hypothetical protein
VPLNVTVARVSLGSPLARRVSGVSNVAVSGVTVIVAWCVLPLPQPALATTRKKTHNRGEVARSP